MTFKSDKQRKCVMAKMNRSTVAMTPKFVIPLKEREVTRRAIDEFIDLKRDDLPGAARGEGIHSVTELKKIIKKDEQLFKKINKPISIKDSIRISRMFKVVGFGKTEGLFFDFPTRKNRIAKSQKERLDRFLVKNVK